MFIKSTIIQLLIAAYGIILQDPLYDFAASLPHNENLYINDSLIADLNGDGMPEVYISAGSGWQYCVYYYMDGEVFTLDGLTPWAWSSDLCYTPGGKLVMSAYPHTMGTAGNMQYRVYEWETGGYSLVEDLWRIPIEWDENGDPVGFEYILADCCIDPFIEEVDSQWLISQTEYEQKVSGFGEMASLFGPYEDKWGWEWWQEHGDADEIYVDIQKELLNWQQ